MFELYYLPLHLVLGEEQPDLPGLVVQTPPRRVHRSRSQDVLIAFLTPFGGAHPGGRVLESMLDEAVSIFYKSRGSATSSLRAAAEHLNHLFLRYNANLQGNRRDGQIFAYLNLAVLREDQLFIVHVGSTATYLLQPDHMQLFQADSSTRGRGLGISRTTPVRYFQARVEPDSLLLLCPDPPAAWDEQTLTHGNQLTINLLRRRMASSAVAELRAGIVQFKATEQVAVHRLRPKSPISATAPASADDTTPWDAPEEKSEQKETPLEPVDHAGANEVLVEPTSSSPPPPEQFPPERETDLEKEISEDLELDEGYQDVVSTLYEEPRKAEPHSAEVVYEKPGTPPAEAAHRRSQPRSHQQKPPQKAARQPDPLRAYQRAARRQATRKKMAGWWQVWKGKSQQVSRAIQSAITRLLPGYSEESPQISAGWLFFISLAVPLLVVTAAVSVYMRSGRDQQHQLYLQQAQLYAAEARQETDPTAERSSWNQVFHWLDLAEEYRLSDESELLRKQASAALDLLDGIERLEFNPLLPFGFSSTLNFTQIAANDTEVYLLDSSQGRVLRLFLTGQGYELDNEFTCGPGASGTRLIGDLVDMITLPPSSPSNASIMAVDAKGNLLYCIPGDEAPLSGELISPPDGWGSIRAIAYYQGSLFVLDSLYGAVYSFRGYNMEFGDDPIAFFDPERDESIPNLREMIDLAAYGEDLYLLNENGTIAWCTSGIFEGNQTRCENPATFGDMRPGMDARTLIFPNAYFTQIQASLPPDPSLFLLDVNAPAIYRFSLQLNLDRLFQPSQYTDLVQPEPPATAFALSPSRILFLAFGDEVIYASLNR